MFAKVIIDIANSNVDRLFTYRIPEELNLIPGQRVLIPFGAGNKQIEGFALELTEDAEVFGINVKSVVRTLEPYAALTAEQIKLAYEIAEAYHCLLVDALRLMIPAQLRGGRVKEKTLRIIKLAPGIDAEASLASLKKKDGSSRAPIQTEIIELLLEMKAPLSVPDITSFIPGAGGAVTALIKKGIIADEGFVTYRSPFHERDKQKSEPLPLTSSQERALNEIRECIKEGHGTCLLHGVTGSGKTEVYMHAIADVVASGGRAIVLVPEISLTPQAMQRFRSRFGDRVAVLHSRLSPGERYDEWRRIRFGKADVIIGARSAIFAPAENVKLIIIDEEHELSYRSETTPRYAAAEIASRRARLSDAVIVLGSATPSVKTYSLALSGAYKLVELPERINKTPLPEVTVVDMRREFASGNTSIFSGALYQALEKCLSAHEQAILFMNRRGYSTFVSCRGCGYVMKCEDCDVPMTYHKHDGLMKCHYCGSVKHIPKVCPECGKPYLKYFGVGTEQVEEQLMSAFPEARAIRMDFDTTRGKNAHYELLSSFQSGAADVLIGTQMVAKGLDMPLVTLVGVIAADSTLFIPDYRSSERTFQLLTQVAGRAGRAERAGRVIVQSYTPEHPIIELASHHDYEGFYKYEMGLRRDSLFPPYSVFVRVLFTGKDEDDTLRESDEFAKGLKLAVTDALEHDGGDARELLFIFSAFAPIRKKQGEYRAQTLMKLLRTKRTKDAIEAVYAYYREHRAEMTGQVEINPSDMF